MQILRQLRSISIALCTCVALLAGAPSHAQHAHVGYAGGWHGGSGWHGGYGWRGGYYGGWRGYYGGWRYPYYGWGWYGAYYPWGWWPGYGVGPYYAYSPYGWGGGAPYYVADNAGPHAGAADQGGSSPGPASQPVVDPRNGQSQEQQGKDTFECHRWAVGQTGFDPTQGAPGKRSEYFRAQAACLEGRGYTVK
jgi:hypothetical protein